MFCNDFHNKSKTVGNNFHNKSKITLEINIPFLTHLFQTKLFRDHESHTTPMCGV